MLHVHGQPLSLVMSLYPLHSHVHSNRFAADICPTTGYYVKPNSFFCFIQQVISCNKNICTLQITDTTGSHQFPAMQRLSITKGHAFLLVYSVCSRQSLEELRPIWNLIKELKPEISQIPVMLVGNKCDESAELREVTATEGQAEAAAWGVSFMETSAKTNHNVTELFQVSSTAVVLVTAAVINDL